MFQRPDVPLDRPPCFRSQPYEGRWRGGSAWRKLPVTLPRAMLSQSGRTIVMLARGRWAPNSAMCVARCLEVSGSPARWR
eukprot:819143-Lingulodinium_polyedra.AAC.1